jgi:hypothetical protein
MLIGIASDPIWQMNYRRLVANRKKLGGDLPDTEPEFRLPPLVTCNVPLYRTVEADSIEVPSWEPLWRQSDCSGLGGRST